MGHYLATSNPEAAAAIQPEVELVMPEVGDTLKFFPRNGEARGGRTDYFIQVTRVHPDGRVDGIVPYDAADARDVVNVPYLPTVPRHPGESIGQAWDWRASDRRGTMIAGSEPDFSGQTARIDRLFEILDRLNGVSVAIQRIDGFAEALADLGVNATALLERVERLEDKAASQPEAPRVKRKYVRKTPASSA